MIPTLNQILVDSSFLYVLLAKDHPQHNFAKQTLAAINARLIIPYVALTETAFLFRRAGGTPAVMRFLEALLALQVQFEPVLAEDLIRAREIMGTYLTANLDFVDCCLMALSERLMITQICTFDRRDFSIFRPKHCDYLEILP